ncbi:unnamed protein product [Adineta steineri]|uniref:F-box domain-containing protein n=1 Tax=Adineta steineri TaxID=433720 RepID=A0A819E3N7_9BILA|nr:unnamed protein product [Adineta steineri]
MNKHNISLPDLPTEILLFILKKLNNIEVLYSLLDVNNQRLDIIAQDKFFTTKLNFVMSQSINEISSISNSTLNRFCFSILPRIHRDIKSLILDSNSMECILRAAYYPNLTNLEIYNFNNAIVSHYFIDGTPFQHIFKQQITDLILYINEDIKTIKTEYTENDYAVILSFFQNLRHLTIVSQSSVDNYPYLLLQNLPLHIFSSPTLTKLSINVYDLNDVYALLDGRLKQLTKLIVQIKYIDRSAISYNRNDLSNLKHFSLTCHTIFEESDNVIVHLLHRMQHLEELTLYLHLYGESSFIYGTYLDNEIVIHLSQLHSFTFYIASQNDMDVSDNRLLHSDIEHTFKNQGRWQVACMVDNFEPYEMIYRVFSLPFQFHLLEQIGNNIPNIIFNSVTHLSLWDKDPFKYEFFIRLTRAFPFLRNLSIDNIIPSFLGESYHVRGKDWCSIIEYPHLISLDVKPATISYVEEFLNETKTHLPHLTELKVTSMSLKRVTENFTKDEMRRNCAGVKRLIVDESIVYTDNMYRYFPSLLV